MIFKDWKDKHDCLFDQGYILRELMQDELAKRDLKDQLKNKNEYRIIGNTFGNRQLFQCKRSMRYIDYALETKFNSIEEVENKLINRLENLWPN